MKGLDIPALIEACRLPGASDPKRSGAKAYPRPLHSLLRPLREHQEHHDNRCLSGGEPGLEPREVIPVELQVLF